MSNNRKTKNVSKMVQKERKEVKLWENIIIT
jgi:hypothetical protein